MSFFLQCVSLLHTLSFSLCSVNPSEGGVNRHAFIKAKLGHV